MVALPGVLPLVGVMAAPLEADATAPLALPPPEVGGGAPADDSMDEPPADARFVPETVIDQGAHVWLNFRSSFEMRVF